MTSISRGSLMLLFLLNSWLGSGAQTMDQMIDLFGEQFPGEKTYLHFDKGSYLPGETIWFKAYIFEENEPTARSTNLYVSLYDENGKALQQKFYPIINASTEGHFDIPDTIRSNQLICRAYTGWMMNFDEDFLFTRTIPLLDGRLRPSNPLPATDFKLVFFPEGGDIIEGEKNNIAFLATNGRGLPIPVNGVVKMPDSTTIVTTFQSIHDGMGRFELDQKPGEPYYAEWKDPDGQWHRTALPAPRSMGVSLRMVQQRSGLVYHVVNKLATDQLHVLAYMYQKVIYKSDLPLTAGDRYTGFIPLDSFPSGVLQLTVFNDQWLPVAERVCFIRNNRFRQPVSINYKKVNLERRQKNSIEISLPDTIPANLSLSVTDADIDDQPRNTNIITGMLLGGDVRGYIHDPAYYFGPEPDTEAAFRLDLVMLTHGWRRYQWDLLRNQQRPGIRFPQDNYLGIYGQISEGALKKMKSDDRVNIWLRTRDSTNTFYQVSPDEKGYLTRMGLIFYDTANIYSSLNKNKELNNQVAFSTYNFSMVQPVTLASYARFLDRGAGVAASNRMAALFQYQLSNNKNEQIQKGKLLEQVTVRSGSRRNWKNDPLLKMDEKYTSGLFSSGAYSFAFDLVNDEEAQRKLDIYSYMMGKVPGLTVGYPKGLAVGNQRSFIYNQQTNEMGSNGVLLFINEQQVEPTEIEAINLSEIAYIKFIPKFMGGALIGPGQSTINPALSIYLKKGDDRINIRPKLTDQVMVKIPGYSPVREFYSPDYSLAMDSMGTDARSTLLWVPYIFTGKNMTRVPLSFYNNDLTKRFRIVLEGITESGKLIHEERIIE